MSDLVEPKFVGFLLQRLILKGLIVIMGNFMRKHVFMISRSDLIRAVLSYNIARWPNILTISIKKVALLQCDTNKYADHLPSCYWHSQKAGFLLMYLILLCCSLAYY